jgi:Adenovirus endoprotease
MAALKTEQLECLLDCTVDNTVRVLGVFAADCVPMRYSLNTERLSLRTNTEAHTEFDTNKQYCFILNTHPSSAPGEHWLAFLFNHFTHKLEYFDSFGFALNTYADVYAGLDSCGLLPFCEAANNVGMLQSLTSTVCGHYCVAFLFWRSKNVRTHISYFARFIMSSHTAADRRDKLIVELLREVTLRHPCCAVQLFGFVSSSAPHSSAYSQSCCCRAHI